MKKSITRDNLPLLCMAGLYALLLFFPHTIGNEHVRVIISEFLIFILPGCLIYKLVFSNQEHDLYHRLSLFFLLSCFFQLITASVGYYFRLNLLLFMKSQFLLFIIASGIIFYKDRNTLTEVCEKDNTIIWDYGILFIVAIIAYVFTCDGPWVSMSDAVPHLAVTTRIVEAGVIAPSNPFFKGIGPMPSYLYAPYHVILALIQKLSASNRLIMWHHTPKIIFFFLPLCYFTLIKVAFKSRKFAYFALFFMVGLILSGSYWRVLQEPVPRRFLRDLLIPIYYFILIQYFRKQEKKDLMLLVICTMALAMYHLTGVPFILFHGLLYILLFLFFRNRKEVIKKLSVAYILVLLFNLPYAIAVLVNSPVGKVMANVPQFSNDFAFVPVTKYFHIFKPKAFLSTDTIFGYLAIILLILIQSNSALTLIMFAALIFVPIFTLFPPVVTMLKKLTGSLIVYRLTDVSIMPFFSIVFILLLSFCILKYLEDREIKQRMNVVYWFTLACIIGINSLLISQCFWVHRFYFYPDLIVSYPLHSGLWRILPFPPMLIAAFLYFKKNRKKKMELNRVTAFDLKNNFHMVAVLFVPIILNTLYKLPGFISKSGITPIIKTANTGLYTLDENYVPELFKYIKTHENPNSVVILIKWKKNHNKDYHENSELPQFIPQFVFTHTCTSYFSCDEMKRRRFVAKDIYDVNVSLEDTIDLIYKNEINYIVAHGDDHKKFSRMKNNLLLVSQDKKNNREFANRYFLENGEEIFKYLIDKKILHYSEKTYFDKNFSYVYFDQSITNKNILKRRLDLIGIKDKGQIEFISASWDHSQDIYLYKVLPLNQQPLKDL